MMKKIGKSMKIGVKVLVVGGVCGSVLGFGYLQYINSKMGPINLDYDEATSYYKEQHKMSNQKANITYYFALWNLSVSRIVSYQNYVWYCERLNNKIIAYSLQNYQNAKIFEQIEKAGPVKSNKAVHQKIYKKIEGIRRKNAENIEDRQYVIKAIFDYQKELNSNKVFNIPQETIQKIQKLHKYLIEVGITFRDPELLKKIRKLQQYQSRFPKDLISKIFLI